MIVDIDGNKIEKPDLEKGRLVYMYQIGDEVHQRYVPYTQEELDAMEAERNKLTQEERIAALEDALTAIEEGIASV